MCRPGVRPTFASLPRGPGPSNALRVITKNLLAVTGTVPALTSIDWLMGYLVVPLAEPVQVDAGEEFTVRFDYAAGAEISALMSSATARRAAVPSRLAESSAWAQPGTASRAAAASGLAAATTGPDRHATVAGRRTG